ncbi:ureidoglycolate lyase [Anatilimnocola sp. NA78]|uniref:ureidoglycolate lyase n=1 Tax=Anatilimnocola sp. NA78 TaxID=3415683 RepID=UPI003CE4BBB7
MNAPNLKPLAATMPDLPVHRVPLVKATAANLRGFGEIIEHADARQVEIVRWPSLGWRQVEPGTGDQGGTTEGLFAFRWHGDVLRARNEAVNDDYVLGWTCQPSQAREDQQTAPREELLLWRCNYHPDGGQLFFPLEPGPFVTTLALPGDDITPDSFVAFYSEGGTGLYIHPGVWHEALCPVNDSFRFFGRQGKVHARVGSNFPQEFGCYLSVSLRAEDARETL